MAPTLPKVTERFFIDESSTGGHTSPDEVPSQLRTAVLPVLLLFEHHVDRGATAGVLELQLARRESALVLFVLFAALHLERHRAAVYLAFGNVLRAPAAIYLAGQISAFGRDSQRRGLRTVLALGFSRPGTVDVGCYDHERRQNKQRQNR